VSGLIIGYLTNWLGINLIFRPVNPHIMCGGYVNFQGVFLKRQHQVAGELSTMVCQQLLYSQNIARFLVDSPEYSKVLDMYRKYANQAINHSMGAVRTLVPRVVGDEKFMGVKEDVVQLFLDELPKHADVLSATRTVSSTSRRPCASACARFRRRSSRACCTRSSRRTSG